MEEKYLEIKVYPGKTVIKYYNEGNIYFIHSYPIGIDQITENLVSEIILSDWLSGVMYTLDHISLVERVPTNIYLTSLKYTSLLEKILRDKETYSQFFMEPKDRDKGVRVIIKDINYTNVNSSLEDPYINLDLENEEHLEKSKVYERYTKTISQFKV